MPKMTNAEREAAAASLDAAVAEANEKRGAEPEVIGEMKWGEGSTVSTLVLSDGTTVDAQVDEPAGAVPDEAAAEAARLGLTTGYEFEMVPTEKLQEHPRNINKGDLESIGASMDASGFYGVVIAQRSTGFILAGNHRHRSAAAKGLPLTPTVWVDVDAIGAVRIMLADNETAARATRDLGAQDALIQELRLVDPELKGTGFDVALDRLAAAEAAEEEREREREEREEPEYEEFGAKFGVIVMCRDEAHQAEVYQTLSELELGDLRVVAV